MLALDDLAGLVLPPEQREPFILELLHLGSELLETDLVVVPLLRELQLLDHGLLDVDSGLLRVVVVGDLCALLEGLVHPEAEVQAAVGASRPPPEVEEGARVPYICEDLRGLSLRVHLCIFEIKNNYRFLDQALPI